MIRTKLAKTVLTKAEQKHLSKDAGVHSMAAMKRQVEFMKEQDPKDTWKHCFECRLIARKLGLMN